uniref:Glycosyltransferase n=1 Tax=Oryza nivara TaxID=4536 RepID=A0A0E0HSG5_ORYNI
MARPHAVVVPYPGSGNINPALQLAKLLHGHGVYITFVNTEHNHRRIVAAKGAAAVRGRDRFRFEAIPDGMADADRDVGDYDLALSVATSNLCAAPLRELMARLDAAAGEDGGVPPVTCVVCTALMSFATDVARELGLPTMVMWGGSAASLMTHMRIWELRERGYIPLKGSQQLHQSQRPHPQHLRRTRGRAEYARIYTIGPLGTLLNHAAADAIGGGLSLWKQGTECLAWLDTQQPRSAVYVNFGSLTVMTPERLAEFAWGIAATGRLPVLVCWRTSCLVARPQFVVETDGRRCLATWCSQEQVLRHPAVGCFLTHSGWNSKCESVASGVPMVCWPVFADQYINRKYACKSWDVGLRLDEEVRREQVTAQVKQVMESEEMRQDAARWKAKAEQAAGLGGSSYKNLQSMVEVIRSFASDSKKAEA